MENNTIATVVPAGGVEGNITSCKVETAKTQVTKNSSVSLSQSESYQTYNVCTGEVINTYEVPSMTFFGGCLVMFGMLVTFFVLTVIAD